MAIAFNLPVEREPAADESYSRLNRLLAELYEVLCHILVARAGPESQDARRDRPFSESDLAVPGPSTQPEVRRSATTSPPAALHVDLDDEVFVTPHSETGNDRFSTRNLEIFGARSPRTPAGVLLNTQREREYTFSASSEKQWRDKGGTDSADGNAESAPAQADETDAVSESDENETTSIAGTIIRTIIPRKVSICTAIILMLGWKLLANR